MVTRYLYNKTTCVLFFIIAELMVIASNFFSFFLLSHKPLHIIFTICFLLCHVLLYIIVNENSFLLFLLLYWTTTFLLRIYALLFLVGPMFIRIIHPFCVVISYFFPGSTMLYLPGTVSLHSLIFSNGTILLFFLSIMFVLIYVKKLKLSKSH